MAEARSRCRSSFEYHSGEVLESRGQEEAEAQRRTATGGTSTRKRQSRDEEGKEKLCYFNQKRSMLLFKEFFHTHLPLLPQASSSGRRQQAGLAYRAATTGHCCYHDNCSEQVLEPLKELLCELLEVDRGGMKTYYMNTCCTPD